MGRSQRGLSSVPVDHHPIARRIGSVGEGKGAEKFGRECGYG
jgi:hypothetical protein